MTNKTEISDSDRVACAEASNAAIRGQDYEKALEIIESLLVPHLQVLEANPGAADQLDFRLILSAGDLRTSLSDEEEGIRHYERAGFIAACHKNGRLSILVQAKIAIAAMQAGDFDRAEEAIFAVSADLPGKAAKIETADDFVQWERHQSWLQTRADSALGFFYWALSRYVAGYGQFTAALKCLDRAEFHAKNCRESDRSSSEVYELEVNVELDRVLLALQCGNLSDAQRRLSNDEMSASISATPPLRVRARELTARLALLQGKLGTCRRILENIIVEVADWNRPVSFGRAVLNLCHLLVLINQNGKAKDLLNKTSMSMPNKSGKRLKPRFDFASLAAGIKKLPDETLPTTPLHEIYNAEEKTAGDLFQLIKPFGSPDPVGLQTSFYDFEAHFNVDASAFRHVLLASESPKETFAVLEDIHRKFGSTDSDLVLGRLALLYGIFFLRLIDLENAIRFLNQANVYFSKCDVPYELWQSLSLSTICHLFMDCRTKAEQAARDADRQLRRLAQDLSPEEYDLFMLNKWNFEELTLSIETDHLRDLDLRIQEAGWWRRPGLWMQASTRVVKIFNHTARFRGQDVHRTLELEETADPSTETVSLWRFLLGHSSRCATISFLCLSHCTLVVSRSFLSLNWKVTRCDRLSIRKGVRAWHRLSSSWVEEYGLQPLLKDPDFFKGRTEESIQAMNEISGSIAENTGFLPLLGKLPFWVKEIKIVPDDALHVMPFSAIWSSGKYLFERFKIRFSFGLSRQSPSKDTFSNALIVDVSDRIEEEGLPRLPALLKAEEEGDHVEACLSGDFKCDIVRYPKEAPDARTLIPLVLKSLSEGKRFVHIVSHGLFNKSSPFKSGLLFKPPKGKAEIFSVQDIVNAGALSVDHLYLSACYSSDVFTLPGRWVVGLPEAFCRAGVSNVVGFLWPVEDRLGCALTSTYYQLITEQSFQQAVEKLRYDCLNQKVDGVADIPTRHPFFWASLNIYTRS